MAMSDCIKCWETPCACGHEYRLWSRDKRIKLAAIILGIPPEELEKTSGKAIPDKHPKSDS